MASHNLPSAGSIDESGFVRNLLKQGFTVYKAFTERIANSEDAGATIVYIVVSREEK